MKKETFILLLLIFGVILNSCQKNEFINSDGSQLGTLKVLARPPMPCDLPIFMDQETQIGCAAITHDAETNEITVSVDLYSSPDGWEVTCAHLYAAEEVPLSSAPGLFPNIDCELPISFTIEGPELECPGFDWYFALHLELRMQTGTVSETGDPIYDYETAWVLPVEGGTNWYNKGKGKANGWGQYFQWEFNFVELSQLDLLWSKNLEDWYSAYGDAEAGFDLCLDGSPDFYFLDATLISSVPLEVDNLNAFYLDEVTDEDFWTDWAAKGVDGVNNAGGWEMAMWQIINGDLPMFFLVWDGTDYSLIDGLQYEMSGGTVQNPLRINGDYPFGTYGFTGDIAGEDCTREDFAISLWVGHCVS